jgi:hypothetical protein
VHFILRYCAYLQTRRQGTLTIWTQQASIQDIYKDKQSSEIQSKLT